MRKYDLQAVVGFRFLCTTNDFWEQFKESDAWKACASRPWPCRKKAYYNLLFRST